MTQAQIFLGERGYVPAVVPWLFAHKGIVRGVQSHDRTEYAQLHPAQIELIIFFPLMMAADVMAPPGIARVGSVGGEIRLKIEHLPTDLGVAGKAKRIAVAADFRIAGED